MAELRLGGEQSILLSTDMLVDGTHFDSTAHSLAEIGRKAACCCLSDCAAMAVRPLAMLTSLALPRGRVYDMGRPLLESMMAAAAQFDCTLIGGDTTSWEGGLVIDVAVAAVCWPGCRPITRAGARPGDLLFVTGSVGGSMLGKHMRFTPRIVEAKEIAEALDGDLHALIDVSDGLSLDLQRICTASGCGARLREEQLQSVISSDARRLAERDGRSPLDHALQDGEDFELLLAAAPAAENKLRSLRLEALPIGVMTASGFQLQKSDGQVIELQPKGYEH